MMNNLIIHDVKHHIRYEKSFSQNNYEKYLKKSYEKYVEIL